MSYNSGYSIRRLIGGLLIALCCTTAFPAHAAYVIAPDIVQEYTELREKVLQHPNSAAINFEYAVCLSYMGKIEEGRSALKRVQALDPRFAEKALSRYTEEYRKDPANPKVKFRLGFLYYFDNKFDQALSVLGDIANHQPADQLSAWALAYMAMIKGDQNKWGKAEELVRQALRLEPDAYGLHAALAAALKAQGNFLAAVREYFIALKDRSEFEAYEKTLWPPSAPGTAHSD